MWDLWKVLMVNPDQTVDKAIAHILSLIAPFNGMSYLLVPLSVDSVDQFSNVFLDKIYRSRSANHDCEALELAWDRMSWTGVLWSMTFEYMKMGELMTKSERDELDLKLHNNGWALQPAGYTGIYQMLDTCVGYVRYAAPYVPKTVCCLRYSMLRIIATTIHHLQSQQVDLVPRLEALGIGVAALGMYDICGKVGHMEPALALIYSLANFVGTVDAKCARKWAVRALLQWASRYEMVYGGATNILYEMYFALNYTLMFGCGKSMDCEHCNDCEVIPCNYLPDPDFETLRSEMPLWTRPCWAHLSQKHIHALERKGKEKKMNLNEVHWDWEEDISYMD
jgi:hypothetical protein